MGEGAGGWVRGDRCLGSVRLRPAVQDFAQDRLLGCARDDRRGTGDGLGRRHAPALRETAKRPGDRRGVCPTDNGERREGNRAGGLGARR